MSRDLLQRVASFRFNDQHVPDEVLTLLRHEEGNAELAADDDTPEIVERGTIEGKSAAHKHVKHDTETPCIGSRTVVLEALEHFGRGVRRRTAECFEINALGEGVAEAEVGELKRKWQLESVSNIDGLMHRWFF